MITQALTARSDRTSQAAVLTKAALRAADRLGLNAKSLAAVIGVSEASVSRLKKGSIALQPGTKPFELALLLVRLFRSLDAIVGGDEMVARAWMTGPNTDLGACPIERIATLAGLVDVVAYLDAHRAGA